MTRTPLLRRTPLRPGSNPLRRSRLGRSTCSMKRSPLRKCSSKQRKSNRECCALKAKLIGERGDRCEANLPGCTFRVDHAHHIAGRGPGKNVASNILLCCMWCHQRIESRRLEARELGFSVLRNGRAES